jgi:molybdenum cofactor cytidylyltransferase
MRIAGILLAAGTATRFGGDKLLAPLAERTHRAAAGTAIGVAAAIHLAEALPDSLAVVRPADARLSERLSETGLRIVECANADVGMGASLACGVTAAKDADGWIVALADMPWIAPATIRAVAAALGAGAGIVAPSYRGRRGHPVAFARHHYDALAALTGDAGARALLEDHPEWLTLIDVDDPGILRDVDRPDQLAVASGLE